VGLFEFVVILSDESNAKSVCLINL